MPNFTVPLSDSAVGPAGLIARAAINNPVNSTDGVDVAVLADHAGRLVFSEGHTRENCASQYTSIAASTAETTIVTAGGAGVFNDLTGLIVTTTNAVAATLTFRSATGGATIFVLDYPNTSAIPNVPFVLDFTPPMSQAVANANWTVQASANAGAFKITAQYIKNT
jgi:hypothetical protein